MKAFIKYTALVIGFVFIYLFYSLTLSPYARRGETNLSNSYKVKKGMSMAEALAIMGPNGKRLKLTPDDSLIVYVYQPTPLASSDIAILFYKNTGRVRGVNHGE